MPNRPETVFYGEIPVRTFAVNGRIKYAARDLCGILGYHAPHDMLNPFVKSKPEYIDAITRGGTQKLRVAERGDIEKVLDRCRHRNAPKLRAWLRRGTAQTAPKPADLRTEHGILRNAARNRGKENIINNSLKINIASFVSIVPFNVN